MMDGQPTNPHQRLDQARADLRALLAQVQAAGGAVSPKLRANVEQLQADITAAKAVLRAAGWAVAGAPEDTTRLPEVPVTLVNQASNQGAQGVFLGPVIVNPGLTPRDRDNRRRMLKQVREFWITGVLDQSLYREVLITLDLHTNPQAVGFMGPRLAARRTQEAQPLPPGTTIAQVYQAANQRLLILGAPGGGKTTLLLELARHLLDQAEHDETRPMPVIFNLSSWAQQRRPLEQWLAQELRDQYGVARRIAHQWLADNRVLPLLDGLDEVAEAQRAASVEAINRFLQEHGGEGLVVCSRSADYQALGQHLLLDQAVQLQPLDDTQLDAYLAWGGTPLVGVRTVLEQDTELRELARAPLLLNVLILAYEGKCPEALLGLHAAVQRRHLFDRYIQRMFDRPARNDPRRYTRDQTLRWLCWLAKRMEQNDQTVFQVELIQPWWLRNVMEYGLYILFAVWGALFGSAIIGVLIGMFLGLIFGVGLEGLIWRFPEIMEVKEGFASLGSGLHFGLTMGLNYGLLDGILNGLLGSLTISVFQRAPPQQRIWHVVAGVFLTSLPAFIVGMIVLFNWEAILFFSGFGSIALALASGALIRKGVVRPTEALRWDWYTLRRRWYLAFGAVLGAALVAGVGAWRVAGLAPALIYGLIAGLIFVPFGGLIGGISQIELQIRRKPNQGIWRSLWRALTTSMLVSLFIVLIIWLIGGIGSGLLKGISSEIITEMTASGFIGLIVGVSIAPAISLYFGGLAFVQHFALRFVAMLCGDMPWNYPHFLDYAVDRILLRRVGGSYIFVHRMLLEHFAQEEQ